MSDSRRLLFLQLPRLDPDTASPGENVMLAAACLQHALSRSPEGARWRVLPPLAAQDEADNAQLLGALIAAAPDVVAATLYLWNVERTLRLLAAARRRLPGLRVVVGGPEVAPDHPLLPRARAVDVAVQGEGEVVLPELLRALRLGGRTDRLAVGWRTGGALAWGERPAPARPLLDLLPPAEHASNRPDAHGMAYLETRRGCPLRCAFCCYNLRRAGCSELPPDEVARRVRVLRRRGAREIRLVDPTFNARPGFRRVLAAMRRANRDCCAAIFLELRGDAVTEADARLLAAAGVCEAEVGVQSTDAGVLRAIRRPTDLRRLDRGIARLDAAGVRVTIDFMVGLPGQQAGDVERGLAWVARYPRAHPQFLPTLLLPGTELRARRRELGLRAQALPPYRVTATRELGAAGLAALHRLIGERLGSFDTPTPRFVGARLDGLFGEVVRWDADAEAEPRAAGRANCRRVEFDAADPLALCGRLCRTIRAAVLAEPDILWQFVLTARDEFPLDVLDALVATLRRLPGHWLDRLVSPPGQRRLAARRLYVRLSRGRRWDAAWAAAAADLLHGVFH